MRLILASQSPSRAAILRGAGVEPVLEPADIDERSLEASLAGQPPADIVAALATAAVARGTSFGTPSIPEVELAEEIVARTPNERTQARTRWSEPALDAEYGLDGLYGVSGVNFAGSSSSRSP